VPVARLGALLELGVDGQVVPHGILPSAVLRLEERESFSAFVEMGKKLKK
jgi:hypothetical protein